MKLYRKLWIGLGVLALISPLGLFLPAYFKSGSAWGEWRNDEMQKLIGYLPQGLAKFARLWQAPFSGYAIKDWEGKGSLASGPAYIISAVLGILLVGLLVFAVGKFFTKKENKENVEKR